MPHRSKPQSSASRRSSRWPAAILVIAALAGSAVAATTGLASTKSKPTHPDVAATHNTALNETILVDSHGFTLYELSPEGSQHLLCTTSTCFHFWPPLKAASAKAKVTKAAGVKGKLAVLPRGGFSQITLNGRPLYRFSIDAAKGQAHGEGIRSFGGVWHVVKSGSSGRGTVTTTTSTTATATTTTSTSSTSPYPAY